jgi:hypothetical protein
VQAGKILQNEEGLIVVVVVVVVVVSSADCPQKIVNFLGNEQKSPNSLE